MSTYDQLIEKGEIKGKIEGKIETQTKVIINGFKNGITIKQLSLQTELTIDEVVAILKNEGLM